MFEKIFSVKTYFIVIAAWGILMTFLMPAWQTPDEYTHLIFIGQSIENEEMAQYMMADMPMGVHKIMRQPEHKIDVSVWKKAMTQTPTYERADCLPKGVNVAVIKHLPATVGLCLGVLLGLPTFWTLELAELFAMTGYLVVCWIAIRTMPTKKEILMLFMALPMVIQQVSCLSYDAVLIPLCFLFIAYICNMYNREDVITWKDLLLCTLIFLVICYIKPPYIGFGILYFGIPLKKLSLGVGTRKIEGEKLYKHRWLIRLVILALLVCGVYAMKKNLYVNMILVLAQEWRQTLHLLKMTAITFGRSLVLSMVGTFGWLDASVPVWYERVSIGLALIMVGISLLKKQGTFCRMKQFIWMMVSFIALILLIVFSMVNHAITVTLFGQEMAFGSYDLRSSMYVIPYIGGLQGRYFVPFLPLPFLAIGKWEKNQNMAKLNCVVIAYVILSFVITVYTMLIRYWV